LLLFDLLLGKLKSWSISTTSRLAKVLSPLRNVVASLVPVAESLASQLYHHYTVPTFNTSPSTVIKSMLSEPVKAEANTILEPDIV
jgi:hypothetical protein